MTGISVKGVPILRISDVQLAKQFYGDCLGLAVDWEHYFEPGAPVYMQMSRDDLVLQLTQNVRFQEGTIVFVETVGLEELHAELSQKGGAWELPAVESTPWNTLQMELLDPFGNLLRFNDSRNR